MTGTLFGDNGERPRPPLSLIHQLLSYLYFHSRCRLKMLKKRNGSTILDNLREGLETQPIFFNRQKRRRRKNGFWLLESLHNFCQLLPIFVNIWQRLTTFANFCQHFAILATFINFWQHLAAYCNFWQHLCGFPTNPSLKVASLVLVISESDLGEDFHQISWDQLCSGARPSVANLCTTEISNSNQVKNLTRIWGEVEQPDSEHPLSALFDKSDIDHPWYWTG